MVRERASDADPGRGGPLPVADAAFAKGFRPVSNHRARGSAGGSGTPAITVADFAEIRPQISKDFVTGWGPRHAALRVPNASPAIIRAAPRCRPRKCNAIAFFDD